MWILEVPSGHTDLRDFVFRNEQHMKDWMSQPWAVKDGYRARKAIIAIKSCCGKERIIQKLDEWYPETINRIVGQV